MTEQRSADWFQARLGVVTASRVADVVAKTKSGPSASRANYMAQLICERLTNQPQASYTSPAMLWGVEQEPAARAAYEAQTGSLVSECGLILHPTIPDAGASPDGLIGDDGLVEIKCPETATHLETVLGGGIPARYRTQMLWQMACTGRDWCDFASYDPRLSPGLRLHVARVEADPKEIAALEKEVVAFLDEMQDKIAKLIAKEMNG